MRTKHALPGSLTTSARARPAASPALDYATWHARLRSANTPLPEATSEPRPLDLAGRRATPNRLAA